MPCITRRREEVVGFMIVDGVARETGKRGAWKALLTRGGGRVMREWGGQSGGADFAGCLRRTQRRRRLHCWVFLGSF